ncbi:hypothetical protein [Natrarchaeobaculum sulfurireducens]|uniref:Uncharacterized protein n=1 Tax=Natrarchaeobaculum sulfurireducens TaxID=2044521 RepID=A0A346PQL3_9EURY|nr:hypothetical protein [Natrarchaeobaculum sulfurireducens]AXR81808.1 hypothetical protein AArcMg_1800 [Natrarchaeobaculum sulfurireducens]
MLAWLWQHKFKALSVIFGGITLFLVAIVWLGVTPSDVPLWAWVFLATGAVGTVIGTAVAFVIVAVLYQPEGVPLTELDPVDGDAGAHLISHEKWDDIIVVNSSGEQVPQNRLHEINTLMGPGYECKRYNPDTNVAQVSIAAEKSAVEIRRDRKAIEALDEQYEDLIDNFVEVRARHHHGKREAVKDSVMHVLTILEGIETPAGDNFVSEIIDRTTEESRIDEMPKLEDVAGEVEYERDTTLDMDSLDRGVIDDD